MSSSTTTRRPRRPSSRRAPAATGAESHPVSPGGASAASSPVRRSSDRSAGELAKLLSERQETFATFLTKGPALEEAVMSSMVEVSRRAALKEAQVLPPAVTAYVDAFHQPDALATRGKIVNEFDAMLSHINALRTAEEDYFGADHVVEVVNWVYRLTHIERVVAEMMASLDNMEPAAETAPVPENLEPSREGGVEEVD